MRPGAFDGNTLGRSLEPLLVKLATVRIVGPGPKIFFEGPGLNLMKDPHLLPR